jgi:hypothetical protein
MGQIIKFTNFFHFSKHCAVEGHDLREVRVIIKDSFDNFMRFDIVCLGEVLFSFYLSHAVGLTLTKDVDDADLLNGFLPCFAGVKSVIEG